MTRKSIDLEVIEAAREVAIVTKRGQIYLNKNDLIERVSQRITVVEIEHPERNVIGEVAKKLATNGVARFKSANSLHFKGGLAEASEWYYSDRLAQIEMLIALTTEAGFPVHDSVHDERVNISNLLHQAKAGTIGATYQPDLSL